MSSRTWTPAALSFERRALSGACWRVVEAQHTVSTLKLVDTLAEQALLEGLIEQTKPSRAARVPAPPLPAGDAISLRFALSARLALPPRRHDGHLLRVGAGRHGHGRDVFARLLFFAESPATPWPANAGEFTAFSARFATRRGLDLMRPPLAAEEAWTHPTDYTACQALADAARAAEFEVIRYRSVRDPARGANIAILACPAFKAAEPVERQTWRIQLGASGAHALCEYPGARLGFTREVFAADPRIAAPTWERG
jgi:hypothetical protein